jgi:two-component system, sensor histidine kinase and response regulator
MERPLTKILFIEDDEEDYILLQKLLAKIPAARYALVWSSSYMAGLAAMLEDQHDLCLLDYRLGTRNGIELVKEARQLGYACPIVLLTGTSEGEIDIQALQAGADDYISKDQLQGVLLHRVIRYAIERKKAEHEREKLLSEQIASRELENKRNEFISMVVHELKTPLTSLKGYAQLLQRRCLRIGDEQSSQLAARMDGQINKLTQLVDDFQDVTRLVGGKLQFHESAFAFDALVDEIVEELQLTTSRQALRREGETQQSVWGDRTRIGQVISNFLTNAMKYAPMTDYILVKSSTSGSAITLCVQDFGPGIAQEVQARVFDPYYRFEDPAQAATPGLGLGLHIAAEIIRQQGGRIWVESTQGQGATFCFRLPLEAGSQRPQ